MPGPPRCTSNERSVLFTCYPGGSKQASPRNQNCEAALPHQCRQQQNHSDLLSERNGCKRKLSKRHHSTSMAQGVYHKRHPQTQINVLYQCNSEQEPSTSPWSSSDTLKPTQLRLIVKITPILLSGMKQPSEYQASLAQREIATWPQQSENARLDIIEQLRIAHIKQPLQPLHIQPAEARYNDTCSITRCHRQRNRKTLSGRGRFSRWAEKWSWGSRNSFT